MNDKILRDFFIGFIKIHILHHAKKEKIYGQEFQKELKKHGYDVSFGTLYPIFHKLCENGLLTLENANVSGKIRKYYSITPKGNELLEQSKIQIKELFEELME
ncbi:MAG: PadR family transcriptional regulator [Spirochaetes bacterium GWD1_27_9]|nr:MAG: PadR family transcriptional regulator [Spirochaetes bacterium GWC1_27_15]OHD30602.1 MAG: PadR family transcriptional regulator [Spirochaetes bacterium GWD1_27_9]